MGTLKNYRLKLHIDGSIKPVAQPLRRIPFQLRDKVDFKLNELFESDLIEEVPDGPTKWVSPLVVIPKSDGDVRICVDMRRANEAVIRERHPIPTVEEVLHRLNGSTMFSKLALKWGFHQIVLDEDSRPINHFHDSSGFVSLQEINFWIELSTGKVPKNHM